MKASVLFIIAMVLFLLTQPCQDPPLSPESQTTGTVAAVDASDDCDEDSDVCSPFCICSCCGVSVGYHADLSASEPQNVLVAIERERLSYENGLPETFAASIWQPPKI